MGTHWRKYIDSDWLRSADIPDGKEPVVEIVSVNGGEVTGLGGKKSKKPVLHMRTTGTPPTALKPFAIGATIGRVIEALYGANVEGWAGKRITLYVTTTNAMSGEIVPCIRVRNKVPA